MKTLLLSSALALILAFSAGCQVVPAPQSDPTHYYTLSLPPAMETALPANSASVRLGLNPIDLEPYLRKGTLVVRNSTNEVVFNDYARWAEPLDVAIARALQMSLSADARIAHVSLAPLPMDERRDFDVTVHVRRADGVADGSAGSVRFVAVVEISTASPTAEVVVQKTFVAPEIAWDGHDYGALAGALSKAVLELSRVIADSLPAKQANR